jgi:hypothetical protein
MTAQWGWLWRAPYFPDMTGVPMARDSRREGQPYHGNPIYRQPLTEEDYARLRASWIDRELADRALISRVAHLEGKALVNARGQGNYAGVVFDYVWPGELNIRGFRLRRDEPEIEVNYDEDGHEVRKETKKYMAAPGSPNMLYFFPETPPELLMDIRISVILVEGEKKTLALWRLANYNSPEPRFLPIGLSGVWNWRTKIGMAETAGGKRRRVMGPLPDLARIPFDGRTVRIAFDSDVAINTGIQQARAALAKELRKRGARVLYIEIPSAEELGL